MKMSILEKALIDLSSTNIQNNITLTDLCSNPNNFNTDICIDFCNKYDNKKICDPIYNNICNNDKYKKSNICSCINSKSPAPIFFDNVCIKHGYKTQHHVDTFLSGPDKYCSIVNTDINNKTYFPNVNAYNLYCKNNIGVTGISSPIITPVPTPITGPTGSINLINPNGITGLNVCTGPNCNTTNWIVLISIILGFILFLFLILVLINLFKQSPTNEIIYEERETKHPTIEQLVPTFD